MNSSIINIKIDPQTKRQAKITASGLGLTLSGVINAYLKQFIRTRTIYISLNEDVLELIDLASENKSDALVIKMKQIVPEFISLNSKFEKFDN